MSAELQAARRAALGALERAMRPRVVLELRSHAERASWQRHCDMGLGLLRRPNATRGELEWITVALAAWAAQAEHRAGVA